MAEKKTWKSRLKKTLLCSLPIIAVATFNIGEYCATKESYNEFKDWIEPVNVCREADMNRYKMKYEHNKLSRYILHSGKAIALSEIKNECLKKD